MNEIAETEKFSTLVEVVGFTVTIVFFALGFNWFAGLGWFEPFDAQTFGSFFIGMLYWARYMMNRVALMQKNKKPTAWKYAVAAMGTGTIFYVGMVIW